MVAILLCANPLSPASAASSGNEAPTWLKQPLSLQDCLNIALENNSEILKSKEDLKATHGVSVQTRAIVIPKAQINGDFNVVDRDSIDRFPQSAPIPIDYPNKSWSMQVR
ncbi:MAG: hypothetical protein K9N52_11125, partial [Verrucomicrobia bacterium]|nr:hypothetical protein [Verrucomicrobiota bacterium]